MLKNIEYKVCEDTVGNLKKEFFKAFTLHYKLEQIILYSTSSIGIVLGITVLILLIKRAPYPVAIGIVALQVLVSITGLEFAIYTSDFIDKFKDNGSLEYGYFRSDVFRVFSGVVPVMSDFIMASMYFTSGVGLYTTEWHKKLIFLFVLVACFFISFALYGLILNLRGLASEQQNFAKLIC